MSTINDFFIMDSYIDHISEDDYKQTVPIIAAYGSLARLTYKSLYIIDFYKKNFLYVSENPFFLCGLSSLEIKELGLMFHIDHIPEEEHNLLLEINRSGFSFFNRTPLKDRLKLTFSCDFHIRDRVKTTLINHKLTPLALSGNGNLWLAGCIASLSSWRDSGHIKAHMEGKTEYWTYSLENQIWEKTEGIMLNDREKEILSLSCQGLTMNEIAGEMCISLPTVKVCKSELFKKIGVNNISEALSFVSNTKLI